MEYRTVQNTKTIYICDWMNYNRVFIMCINFPHSLKMCVSRGAQLKFTSKSTAMHIWWELFTWNLQLRKAAQTGVCFALMHAHTGSDVIDKFISSKFWPTRETFHLIDATQMLHLICCYYLIHNVVISCWLFSFYIYAFARNVPHCIEKTNK